MKRIILFLSISIILINQAQSNSLDEYVQYGLENNLALTQNNLSLEQAEYALRAAKGLYLPEVKLNTRFSLAQGGRTIDFPIGDLLNPVYGTLNQMLEQQGQEGSFPIVENEQINFLRQREYDASLSLIQPIYSRTLALNKKMAEEQRSMSNTELELFKRELSFSIREAYYNYLMTVQMTELIVRTKEVVSENYRVTQKLFENDMTARDAVLRAKSDESRVKLLESTLLKNREIAKNYFNFIINRDLNETISIEQRESTIQDLEADEFIQNALEKREELQLIESQTQLFDYQAQLNRSENLPQVALAIDAGLQGEDFSSIQNNDYIMGSLVLNWTLFKGNVNKNKRQHALIGKLKSETQYQEVSNQISLEVRRDYLSVKEQKQNLKFANDRQNEASEVYRIINKRYREGEAALIELLDARNNMVEAESELINTEYSLLIAIAQLEKSSNTLILQ